jgi:hypothetical protein
VPDPSFRPCGSATDLKTVARNKTARKRAVPRRCRGSQQRHVSPAKHKLGISLEVRCSIELSYRGLRRSLCALVHATGAAWTFGVELSRVGEQARGADVAAKPDLHATVIGSYMVSVVDSVGKSFASGQLERDGLR